LGPQSGPAQGDLSRQRGQAAEAPMNFFDTNCWLGPWPFAPIKTGNTFPPRKGTGYDIQQSLVSSFDSIFQTDPMPGNRSVAEAIKRRKSWHLLPVINPGTPAWQDHFEEVTSQNPVMAIRMLPAYHGFSLDSPALRKLVETAESKNLRLVIVARLVDERHEHHGVSIKPVSIKALSLFLAQFPKLNPLIQGLDIHQLHELSETGLGFSTDTSIVEWEDTLKVMKKCLPVSRILFGSLAPLQVTQAQVDKVRLSSVSLSQRDCVAYGNATRYFKTRISK
ncbi:MAG: hypothetical protein KJT03_24285, partial [Verrucomicrobiae bacterium]|nr:hypothetical protein [Verrucomicrobiae bacterium]